MASFMDLALEEARAAGKRGEVPIGCVLVHDGAIVAGAGNRTIGDRDPTAHAEIVAIREACRKLASFRLTGCEVYCSCEPCPMCLGALYWARPAGISFAATREDAAAAGFEDSLIYWQIGLPYAQRSIPMLHIADEQAIRPFEEWAGRPGKVLY